MAAEEPPSKQTEEEIATRKADANVAKAGGTIKAPPADQQDVNETGDAGEISKLKSELKTAQAGDKTAEAQDQYTQLADAQAQQFLGLTKSLDPLTSGATLPAIESTASANAAQMLGQSSTSPISQWLNQQTQAAQAQNAPVEAAEQQTAKAQDYSAQYLAGGLQNMGKAEDQLMASAPYEQLLQTLAADVPYKLLNNETIQQIMPEVTSAEKSLGLATTASGQGIPSAPPPLLPPVAGSQQSVTPLPETTTQSLTS